MVDDAFEPSGAAGVGLDDVLHEPLSDDLSLAIALHAAKAPRGQRDPDGATMGGKVREMARVSAVGMPRSGAAAWTGRLSRPQACDDRDPALLYMYLIDDQS